MTAPISGVITASNVEEGDTYSGGSMFQIDDTTDFVVSTSVDEYDISSVKTGQRVVVLTEVTGEDEIEGEITFVAPSTGSATLSSGNAQSSETAGLSQTSSTEGYAVEITLQGENGRLRLGLTARCSIILEEAENVYAVPYISSDASVCGFSAGLPVKSAITCCRLLSEAGKSISVFLHAVWNSSFSVTCQCSPASFSDTGKLWSIPSAQVMQ